MGELDDILRAAAEAGASDVHLQVGLPPILRMAKRLVPLPGRALDAAATERLILPVMSAAQQAVFRERLAADFSYGLGGLARFRMHVFRERGAVAGAFRRFPLEIPTPESLGLPQAVMDLGRLRRGFVLVTGAAGQGKSTTLAALLDRMNQERQAHIITLEDPIEYLFRHKASIVVQREIGADTPSFDAGLRAALREDPDVILVGEMRDHQTVEAALTAAETGHLVFATLHTQNAAQSIDRVVDVFPPHQQQQVRVQLSNVLRAVVTQQLIARRDRVGLGLAVELLLVNAAIRHLIRDAKTFQIQSVLQTGAAVGMVTMEASLKALADRGEISVDDAMDHAIDDKEMARLLGRR
jgi:twitching motility protein PilT